MRDFIERVKIILFFVVGIWCCAAVLVLTSGCRKDVKAAGPHPPARVIEVPVPYYVPVPTDLTARCLIAADGTVTGDPKIGRPWQRDILPSQSIRGARERAACLDFYENNDDATKAIEGQPVPAAAPTSD